MSAAIIRRAPGWHADAACRTADASLFFGPDNESPADREAREASAKAVCAACPVKADCLAWALDRNARHGVLGGMGEDERRKYRSNDTARRRRASAA